MIPLATALDVAERLGRPFTSPEEARVEALLQDASAKVRAVSTQQFTLGTSNAVPLAMRKARVRLPQRPVVSIETVTDVNGNSLSYTQAGEWLTVSLFPLNAWEVEPYRNPPTEVLVSYTHGGTVPDLIIGVVCAVVARALGSNLDESGVFQESVDGYSIGTSVTMGTVLAQGGMGLLASEIEICESFKRPGSPISMMA